MNDYTNTMNNIHIPTSLKIAFFILVFLNIYFYKKNKISRYIEEDFPNYLLTYGSLASLLAFSFIFATYNRDLFLEITSIILGIGISLSYMYSIYEDAEYKKIGIQWFYAILIIVLDSFIFIILPDKIFAYTLLLLLNLLLIYYETKKRTSN